MSEKQCGILVIGAGWVSTQHISAYVNNPNAKVCAICDINLDNARKRAEEAGLTDVAFYDNADDALKHEGIDAVSICTPQHIHCENALAAAKAGKHMIIEKHMGNIDMLGVLGDGMITITNTMKRIQDIIFPDLEILLILLKVIMF